MNSSSVSVRSPLTQTALRPPRRLLRSLRMAADAVRRIPREELSPAGMWVEDHARFLLGEADALRRALRAAPACPAPMQNRGCCCWPGRFWPREKGM